MKFKIIGQYLLNFGMNFLASWVLVTLLRTYLPVTLTHGNVPEVPPTPLADLTLVLVLLGMMLFVNWLLSGIIQSQFTQQRPGRGWLQWLNWLGAFWLGLSVLGISLVVNEDSFSDLMTGCFNVAQWLGVALTLLNLWRALARQQFRYYLWALGFQSGSILLFWLILWITPA